MNNTLEVYNNGIRCLIDNIGIIDTEEFIATVKRENFDYTKWQREYYDSWEKNKFANESIKFAKNNTYNGNGRVLTENDIG